MNALKLFAALLFSSALMGCQIEVAPLSGEQIGATSTETDTSEARDDAETVTETTPEPSSVTLYWSAPLERVNGELMTSTEIGGYEIRYKRDTDDSYSNVVISDAAVEQYSIDELEDVDSYSFEVAVFDTDGIYSDFVVALAN
jgi:hypothetical protein